MCCNVTERFEKKACNSLFWAPSGQFIVLAGLRNLGGTLEFVDTNDFSIMNSTEHFSCSDVEWDPTGRYVVTAVSYWKSKVSQLNLCPLCGSEASIGARSTWYLTRLMACRCSS